jgi:phenylacetic acid degradation operon negative regulatory protein
MTTPSRPQDLVFTLFGDYLLHRQGAVWVGSLIALLRPLGLSPEATRTVLSRMGRKGWLDTRRVGKRSYYFLTDQGRRLLEEGEARIYHPPTGERWDGLWYLVAYSIPEERRALRDRLRLRLQWLGFGQLGNGLWISPHRLRGEIDELARGLGIADHLEVFRAQYQGFASTAHLVAQAWDLPALDERYAAFLARHEPAHAGAAARLSEGRLSPEEAYVRRFRLTHEYREFPLLDPYLPRELLPPGWHGHRAAALFDEYHRLLGPRTEEFVRSVLEVAPAVGEPQARSA